MISLRMLAWIWISVTALSGATYGFSGYCFPTDKMRVKPKHYLESLNYISIDDVASEGQCRDACISASTYICRSVEYTKRKRCRQSLSDSVEWPDRLKTSNDNNFSERECATNEFLMTHVIGTSFGPPRNQIEYDFRVYSTVSESSTRVCAMRCAQQSNCQYFAHCATDKSCHLAAYISGTTPMVDIFTLKDKCSSFLGGI
ncbi:uncharacterized protein LOC141914727 isoform X2 [Tubulanus polymorphus]|uniref:uncharacterized protein LOC141914727 isoform X2 n=1 Tax=Tubulanus polymorphus TaxID=672921 RepID=UPI003DA419E3